ncbi:hypothetical protein [Amycolatopsis sp. NPDC051903]|uniref:hypothetical protein n=1 Tax=Amycolatopsis sp. NPDC051903 TaxID=3363936 RepID=UPI0037873082
MRRRVDQRMWLTWQEAYCEAVAHDMSANLRGAVLFLGVLITLVVAFPTTWVVLPAGVAGAVVACRAVRWSLLLAAARAGRLTPPR